MPTSKAPRVLVVDDHPDAAEVWALYLRSAGFEVETARDGEQALHRVRESRPDVVVTDLALPRVSGLELARALRADAATRDLPLIAATGSGDQEVLAEARLAFHTVLVKPCDPDELVRQLRLVLTSERSV
jgi:CheY-like chemotaxis protein